MGNLLYKYFFYNMIKLILLGLSLFISTTFAAKSCGQTLPPTYGPANNYSILNGDVDGSNSVTTLLKTVDNGKLYSVAVENDGGNSSTTFYVMHVYGTAEDWGVAQGEMLGEEIKQFYEDMWAYMIATVETSYLESYPTWLADLIISFGLEGALDLTYEMTKDWVDPNIWVELEAICNTSDIDFLLARNLLMLPGLTQGACSMAGLYGDALQDPSKLFQLRALDWDMDCPVQNYPSITVYHPSEDTDDTDNFTGKGPQPWINVGFTGFIGALTGLSSAQLAISEIGVTYPDETYGEMSRVGVPFIFLLRDILQYDYTVDDATTRMADTMRTCNLILGVGDGKLKQFNGYSYGYSTFDVYNDLNMKPDNDTWHGKIKDAQYWGMDWICPSYNYALHDLIMADYGNITAESIVRNIPAKEQSGTNHIAIYELTQQMLYVSFSAGLTTGGPVNAYDRQYVSFNATKLYQETL